MACINPRIKGLVDHAGSLESVDFDNIVLMPTSSFRLLEALQLYYFLCTSKLLSNEVFITRITLTVLVSWCCLCILLPGHLPKHVKIHTLRAGRADTCHIHGQFAVRSKNGVVNRLCNVSVGEELMRRKLLTFIAVVMGWTRLWNQQKVDA
jgi:hypothetical protein